MLTNLDGEIELKLDQFLVFCIFLFTLLHAFLLFFSLFSPSLYTCVSVNTSLSVSYKNYNIASLGLNSKTLGFILALGISFVNYI